MRNLCLFIVMVFSVFNSFAQENERLSFEGNTSTGLSEISWLGTTEIQNESPFYEFGQFNIPQIEGFSFVNTEKMDILALGQQMGYGSQPNYKFPESQNLTPDLKQNRFNKHNFRVQTNAYLNPDNKKTPDGGIRNNVYEGVEQPFINPYRGYNPYYNRNFNRSNRSGLYFSRR